MKKILIISSFIIVLLAISTVGYSLVSASEQLNEVQDIITIQEKKEAYLTPYGYTFDNPNIILDPYGISPLTALILFETEDELPVTITIKGKDQNSTYTNTFDKTNKHYLPIYGLYPNTTNYIDIKCGKVTKTFEIKTSPLPSDLKPITTVNNTNKLNFITTDKYPYALDSNNEVRWYLTKNYSKKINYLENGRLLLSNDTFTQTNLPNGLLEIDLLGKVYKQYNINTGYLGSYAETENTLFILSTDLIEIDPQTGTILSTITLENQYNEVFYNSNNNTINLTNQTDTLIINLQTKEQSMTTAPSVPINEHQATLPLYTTTQHYQLIKGVKFTDTTPTKQSDKNIFLINYKEPDQTYNNYNINITKTPDNLQITGSFNEEDEVYLILDKFLDKRIYDINSTYTIINKEGLTGEYSIYLSINDTIYKTNTYIEY